MRLKNLKDIKISVSPPPVVMFILFAMAAVGGAFFLAVIMALAGA